MNEAKTENIVRQRLRERGFYKDRSIVVEEKKSDLPKINKLLKNASKKGDKAGYPEFLIRSTSISDFLIVVECKADTKKHISKDLDRYAEYAVDGALLYASFLSKEYDVLAIAVSGEDEKGIRISNFFYPRGANTFAEFHAIDILDFENYYEAFNTSEIKYRQDYEALLAYTRDLNELLHVKKIKESQRALLISGILIALQNKAFRNSYKSHNAADQLAKSLVQTIVNEFSSANLTPEGIRNLKQAYSFITTSASLTTEKEFFVGLIEAIDNNINSFIRTNRYYDAVGQFYTEFLRYANNDKGLGIVLTPSHIAELFAELAEVTSNSVVFDNCCGTAGLLLAAMKKMVDAAKSDNTLIEKIKKNQLVGIEFQDDIYALAVSNMVIHGDGKTNIYAGDCFKNSMDIKVKFRPNVGLLNPPYKTPKSVIEELDFVLNNLETLQPGGKCIAIVPLSCALAQKGGAYERKKKILEKHTLEAVMSMPVELFNNSHVNVVTCIMVITANQPHPKGKKTWLGYWRDDGFIKVKEKGRIDARHTWASIKNRWLAAYQNREVINGLCLMTELTAEDEWIAEAYMKTDYSNLTTEDFIKEIKKYVLFKELNS